MRVNVFGELDWHWVCVWGAVLILVFILNLRRTSFLLTDSCRAFGLRRWVVGEEDIAP